MNRPVHGAAFVAPVILLLRGAGSIQPDQSWTQQFSVDNGELTATGRNPYFILEPGFQLVLEGGRVRLVITVLAETRQVNGVETRIVEERETNGGEPVEVSRNFFALSKRTNSVFYFGEDVDMYKNGKVVSHEGAWLAGDRGARFGLAMPGLPLLNARYYQEIAPGRAMDRAQIVSNSGTLTTPAGAYTDVLEIQETTPLEPGVRESKLYARGVGLIQDGALKLVRYGMASPPARH